MLLSKQIRNIHHILRLSGLRVSNLEIHRRLMNHPMPHSIRAISDLLDEFGVDHSVYASTIREALSFQGKAVIFHGNDVYFDKGSRVEELPADDDCVLLTVDHICNGKSHSYSARYILSQMAWIFLDNIWVEMAVIACFMAILVSLLYGNHFRVIVMSQAFLCMIGAIVAVMTIPEFLPEAAFLAKVCRRNGQDTCRTLIDSDGGRFLGIFPLGVLAFAFFSAMFLTLILRPESSQSLALQLSILSIPFVIYSIITQARKRMVCSLCLTIDLILFLLLIFSTFSAVSLKFQASPSLIFCLGFLLTYAILLAAKENRAGERRQEMLHGRLEKILLWPDMLWNLISRTEVRVPVEDIRMSRPIANNFDSGHSFQFFLGLDCRYCGEALKVISELVSNDVGIRIEIFIYAENDNSESSKAAKAIVGDAVSEDGSWNIPRLLEDIDGWRMKRKRPAINSNAILSEEILDSHRRIFEKYDINHTPTVLADGRNLPSFYVIKDIPFIV